MDSHSETSARPGRRVPRWLRRTVWISVWVATVLVLAVTIENWLGAREWRKYVEEARAAGESLELAAVVPPPAADADNFAAIPLFQPLFEYERAAPRSNEIVGDAKWRDPAGKERLENLRPFGEAAIKNVGYWREGTAVDLGVWQEALRKEFPAELSSSSTPGEDVLKVLARFDADMEALRAAAGRPRSRFPVRYEEHVALQAGHLSALAAYGKVARARALARLSLGETNAALNDLLLAVRIAQAPGEEPLLISHLVIASQVDALMQPLWEGLNRREWNDAQLAALEAALARFDLVAGLQLAIRGERSILGIRAMDAIKQQPGLLYSLFGIGAGDGPLVLKVSRVYFPPGWVDFNKAMMCRYYDRQLGSVNPETHRVFPEVAYAEEKAFQDECLRDRKNPRKMLGALFMPALLRVQQRLAAAQVAVDLARIAIGIERYRIKHGSIPAELGALVPDCLAKAPHDVMSGNPYCYSVQADGTFRLYSVGWNGRDDGGAYAWEPDAKTRQIAWENGDWPWPQAENPAVPE